jgi:hypothetical protein
MFSRIQLLSGIMLLVFAAGATDCLAQFGGRGSRGGQGGMSGGARGDNRDQEIRPGRPDLESLEQVDYRLSILEEDLRLNPTQRTPWDSFANKVRAYAGDIARARARIANAPLTGGATGVQHIEQAADDARNRATALDDIAIAAKTLYAALTPEQKYLADSRIATIVAPPPRTTPAQANGANLPDLGAGGRVPR